MNPGPYPILLVDDHEILRRGLRAYLQQSAGGSVVGEAACVQDAFQYLRAHAVALVVMDLDLPDGSGLQATIEVKSLWPKVKVIILSGNSGSKPADSLIQQLILSGADAFVSKLDGEVQLGLAIKAVMSGKNYLSPEPATYLFQSLRAQLVEVSQAKSPLSQREYEVLQYLCEGRSYKDIASEFEIGVKSVETFRTRGMKKLGLTTREELLRYARQPGLPKP